MIYLKKAQPTVDINSNYLVRADSFTVRLTAINRLLNNYNDLVHNDHEFINGLIRGLNY